MTIGRLRSFNPQLFDGLYTIRPTIARLSRRGGRVVYLGTPGGITGVQGPMANSIEDLELYVKAYVGSSQAMWDRGLFEQSPSQSG